MGVNIYSSSALLGQNKDVSLESVPVDELIEKANGIAGVFPGTHFPIFSLEILGRPYGQSEFEIKITNYN
jgi:hypothetical protein